MILIKNGRVIDPKSGTDETLDLLIEDGKIAGIGTHKELLKSCDAYYQIASSQLSEAELARDLNNENDGKEEA